MLNTRRCALLLTIALVAACGDDGSGPTGGGPAGGGPAGGAGSGNAFSIEVVSWVGSDTYNGMAPQEGRRFVLVEQRLSNVNADPVSLSPNLFDVETDTGILVSMAVSAVADGVCPGDASVSAGASFECALLFEIPEASMPATLIYDDPAFGLSASAPFGDEDAPPPLECSDFLGEQACNQCTVDACAAAFEEWAMSECASTCSEGKGGTCACIEKTAGCMDTFGPLLTCAAQNCAMECGAD
jgi:hypothetical protein